MPWPEDHHHQIDEDPFVAAAWPTVQVGPLDQKASINRMLQAWRRLTGGQILIVVVLSFGFVTAEVAVGTEAPTLLNELVSMKAQLASSPPVAEEQRCERHSHKQDLSDEPEPRNKW